MITEITNFVNDLLPEVCSYNLQLEEGLYFEIDFDDEGKPILVNQETHGIKLKEEKTDEPKPKKKEQQEEKSKELSEFLEKCKQLQTVSKHEFQVNKCFNSSEKIFIQTASPFALGFKKEAIEEKIGDRPKLQKALESYFKRAKYFVKPENEQHLAWLAKFQTFCTGDMLDWVRSQELYQKAPDKAIVRILFAVPSFKDFQIVYDDYLNENVLFDADPETGKGISEIMSKFTNQKVFMAHKSAPFKVNFKISTEVAKTIWQFFQLLKRRQRVLPNPLPIFIDKRELNGRIVAFVREDETISYSQMLKKLFEEVPKNDLGSYYLLFFVKKDQLVDLDFVPSFRYHLEGMQITEVIPLGGKMAGKIDNVFEFERRVANKLFDGQLIVEKSNWLKYFDSIEHDPKYMSHNTYNQLLKYRKGFYDYIYKSKREAIQHHAFHDIMRRGILDFIHRDTGKDSKNDHDYAIKEKLNIWFSLYDYFNSSQSNHSDMINKTQKMAARMQEIVREGGEEAFQSDDEFAYASGQLIRFLLSKNESANRSHALLEPFLQKTEPGLFKLAIARAFDTYKHALKFYGGSKRYEFDKLMSIVMGYEPKPGTNMKDHLPLILAGYFAKLVFYSDDQTDNGTKNA